VLESIKNISECEVLLKRELLNTNISFIGGLELSEGDINKLQDMIHNKVRQNEDNELDSIINKAPTCMAVLLVNKAIWDYRLGQYWPLDKAIPNLENVALQNKLGNFFLEYININGLSHIRIERAHRYVGTILLHSGIPQSCLKEFFEEVIIPLLKIGITSSPEIRRFINEVRKENCKRLRIMNELIKLENKLLITKNRFDKINTLKKLRYKNIQYTKRLRNCNSIPVLQEDFERYRVVKHKELSDIDEEINKLHRKRLLYETTVHMYGEKEQELIEAIPNLDLNNKELLRLERLYIERDANYQNFDGARKQLTMEIRDILGLQKEPDTKIIFPSEVVVNIYNKYYKLMVRSNIGQDEKENDTGWIVKLISRLLRLFSSAVYFRKNTANEAIISELKTEIENIFIDSFGEPINEELYSLAGEQFAGKINKLAGNIAHYNKWLDVKNKTDKEIKELALSIGQAASATEGVLNDGNLLYERLLEVKEAEKRRRNALLAKAKLEKSIFPESDKLKEERKNIEAELIEKERIVKQLGKGDLEKGILALKKLRGLNRAKEKNLRQILKIEEMLGIKPDLDGDTLEKTSEETRFQISQLEDYIKLKKQELSHYKRVYPYVDEPVRRFVIYGEDWSQEFILKSVELIKLASEGRLDNARPIGLPDRVTTWFERWWHYGNKESQVKGQKGERLTVPTLFLDTIYKELKLVTGKERIKYANRAIKCETIELIISCIDDNSVLVKKPLRAYSLEYGILETLPIEIGIDILKESYQVSIYLNDTLLRSWAIRGF